VSLLITARWKQNWALLQVGSGLRLITITPRLVTIASLMASHVISSESRSLSK
jgi:hypothetical protein